MGTKKLDCDTCSFRNDCIYADEMRRLQPRIQGTAETLSHMYDFLPNLLDRHVAYSMSCKHYEKDITIREKIPPLNEENNNKKKEDVKQ